MLKEFLKSLRANEQKISMILGAAVIVIVGILIYNYFTGVNRQAGLAASTEESVQPKTHTVVKGEDLWKVSFKYYNDGYKWTEVAKVNNLANPDLIEEGQILVIPELELKEAPTSIINSEYMVIKGDNLWKIAVRAYADGYQWVKIWEANKTKIANPNLIEVGTKLSLPR